MKNLVKPLRWQQPLMQGISLFFKKLQTKKLQIEKVQVPDLLVYSDAVITVSQMGNEANSAVSALIAALKEPELRNNSIITLGNIGVAAEGAIPALIEILQDESVVIRVSVIESLCKIGGEAKTIPSLISTLEDASPKVRASAAFALGCFHQKAKVAVEALIISLRDEDDWVRTNSAEALSRIKDAKIAIPALIIALQDNYPRVRGKAALALANIGKPSEVISSLVAAFSDNDARVRAAIADALGSFAEEGKIAACILVNALEDRNVYVRISSAKALIKIGMEIPVSMEVLRHVFETEDKQICMNAALNLGIIALNIQEKAIKLSVMELEQMISSLMGFCDILKVQGFDSTEFVLVLLNDALESLRKEKRSRGR
jgi:HEAT repeat protein